MAGAVERLDAHEQPSEEMRAEWKAIARLEQSVLLDDHRIDDPTLSMESSGFCQAGIISREQIADAYSHLGPQYCKHAVGDVPTLYHPLLPGLIIIPGLVAPDMQITLMDRLLHRDLSDENHQTNLHLHYQLPYPAGSSDEERSFFSLSPDSPADFVPKDPSVHKPLTARQVLQRRLHWVTLGGQYDWTNRVYPDKEPPQFPSDISNFLAALFPETQAQAAIVNFYSPGDTMMMHRDVSEETDKGLVSLSFGCDGLFMIAPNNFDAAEPETNLADQYQKSSKDKQYVLLRLRSGDAIYMTNESRYAWHGVPKILKETCPAHLEEWPAHDSKFDEWKGWLANKRINLNVRQMKD